jgi:polygalacturonase
MIETKNVLWGDGIHDDYPAIQEMIDSGACEVCLPVPQKHYLISKTLVIPSNFKLKLPRFAVIKLMDGADCFMLKNATVEKHERRIKEHFKPFQRDFWCYVDECSPDAEDTCHDFEIEGGIWDFNNMNQSPNPIRKKDFNGGKYLGHGMNFYNVRNFKISNITFKDPTNYAVNVDTASYFTFENVDFDFNFGNPFAVNMDGLHFNGNCHFGVIRNLKGACYDDLVALNAHEGSSGPISDILIDGLFADGCHSAVRLLSVAEKVEKIHITNVFGTYYQYCIGITKHYPGETEGIFDAITLDKMYVSKAERLPVQMMHMRDKSYSFPLIWIQDETHVGRLTIEDVHRREEKNCVETVHLGKGAVVDELTVNNVSTRNYTGKEMPLLVNNAEVTLLTLNNLSSENDPVTVTNNK